MIMRGVAWRGVVWCIGCPDISAPMPLVAPVPMPVPAASAPFLCLKDWKALRGMHGPAAVAVAVAVVGRAIVTLTAIPPLLLLLLLLLLLVLSL